tara:strand:- start:4244 stop:4426 length:183 start_codon:yes stop_codon:yes gene_type:complete
MAKIVIHAYTQDKNNKHLNTYQELLKTVSNSLGGYVAWIDVVDTTNKTTFKHEDKLEEEE